MSSRPSSRPSSKKLTRTRTFKEVMFLKNTFDELDLNHDKQITAEEFFTSEVRCSVFSGKVKKHIFDLIDKNKDKHIVFTEFLQSYFPKATDAEVTNMAGWAYPRCKSFSAEKAARRAEKLAEAKEQIFDVFDVDTDGTLNIAELKGLGYDDDEVHNLLETYDKDGDMAFTLDEFFEMYSKEYLDKEGDDDWDCED
mmetsp:Transcript_26872/g.32635  ORF Transcript_26872/g.32635 Transcript_26872/m.32635 type:complete len:196 (+) Transcript_26872:259-846(+)|eukprot:CAMPEP_0197866838 /NCGR_PEP_ID=MMETSP1438-20131217/44433_1 /TAXON_ID=1461541 /ORGANISM="Pterosperma sp., Strain CCMP1384" /LENGTH=195 /DNA_ID=CAMNT_0043485441 /DNA_START=240 /DNA_END=827 /DNA_ORIENTATION=-